MNKIFKSATSAILLSILTILTSCSISSEASRYTNAATDDVEITESSDGVKTIRVKKQPVVRNTGFNGASPKDGEKRRTIKYNVEDGWNEIIVSGNIKVEYTPSATYSPIMVTGYAWLMDYVGVTVVNRQLKIGLKNASALEKKNIRNPITVTLSAPPVNRMELAGVASVKVLGNMNLKQDFSALCSGASGIEFNNIKGAGTISLSTGGASNIHIDNVQCGGLSVESYGASAVTVNQNISTRSALINPSGASTLSVNGICDATELRVSVSGASALSIQKAHGAWIEMEAGGASSGHIRSASSSRLYVAANGTSNVEVDSFDGGTLDVYANGVSSAKVNKISATRVKANVSYQCTVTLCGETNDALFESNNGIINASHLKANRVHVSIIGNDAKITVKGNKIYTSD